MNGMPKFESQIGLNQYVTGVGTEAPKTNALDSSISDETVYFSSG